ncbi:MAG: lipid II flippase MurJ [Bacteroidales bacterium]|nr:lipid II flippase MurJ [Bacteroidales bacterium]
MARLKFIDNISGLQAIQLLRFSTFLIISIVFTKSHLSRAQIGNWELFLFISSLLTFFWVSGIIQSLLTLYNRNRTFREDGEAEGRKSPELFNAFLLLTFFSVLVFAMGIPVKIMLSSSQVEPEIPYSNLLLLYILLSSPVTLIEYIYLLNKRPHRVIQYGIYTYSAQMLFVLAPVVSGFDERSAIWGLFAITAIRWVWLIILLRRYTLIKVSYDFIREHLRVGMPLILTFLISGSAQYIDGIIISARYADPGVFAMYRYGAKEFPLVLLLANGLSNALLPLFSTREGMRGALVTLRHRSDRLIKYLFPLSIATMLVARWVYPRLFTPEFTRSADVFMIYLLLIIPRLVFPQTILIGRRKTRVILIVAAVEIAVNVPLSLMLIKPYGVVGVALATFIVYSLEKVFLIYYVWKRMKIRPAEYIPVASWLIWSALLILLFVLIDHRIIDIH